MKLEGVPKAHKIRVDRDGYVCCRVCSCTERSPCNPPCGWVESDLCSSCAGLAQAIRDWEAEAYRANWSAMRREVKRRDAWE